MLLLRRGACCNGEIKYKKEDNLAGKCSGIHLASDSRSEARPITLSLRRGYFSSLKALHPSPRFQRICSLSRGHGYSSWP